jgi:hypothetical protein
LWGIGDKEKVKNKNMFQLFHFMFKRFLSHSVPIVGDSVVECRVNVE